MVWIKEVKGEEEEYYIFDRKLTLRDGDDMWVRGVISANQGTIQLMSVFHLSYIILPLLVVLAILGGYILAGRMLSPISKMSDTVQQIQEGDDLHRRIEIGNGKDELHQLAGGFNQMFDRLEDSFQREKRFTSDASHELRTPLSVILAQCEVILEDEKNANDYVNALQCVERQGKKMSKLINDMLEIGRLESNATRYLFTNLNLSDVISDVCFDLGMIQEKGIQLEYHVTPDIFLHSNQELITRLITNLISNAYRYGKTNGHIFVELSDSKDTVSLTIEDDGIGIAEEEQAHVFERFYQVNKSRTGNGSGLGLSLVNEIMKLHHGSVTLTSVLDHGTTFICIFPKN